LPEFVSAYDHKVSSSHDFVGTIVPNQKF
jgi:hypothetical protein